MTAVELGHVRPLCRCGHTWRAHTYNQGNVCDCDACTGYVEAQDWPRASVCTAHHCYWPQCERIGCERPANIGGISPRPVVAQLLADVAAGLRVLRDRGVEITEEQVQERAANIVTALLGNYRIEEIT